jgi:hypothetical protein
LTAAYVAMFKCGISEDHLSNLHRSLSSPFPPFKIYA